MDDNKNKVYFIPPNYQNRINLLGFITVSWANLIQGLIMGIIPAGCMIAYIYFSGTWDPNYITIVILLFAAGFIPGVVGIYNGTIIAFLSNYNKYRKSRRLTVYNPRVKTENEKFDTSKVTNQMLLPKDRLMIWWNQRRKNQIDTETERINEQLDTLEKEKNLFFEDDEGVVEKPLDYMTSKEKKEYLKERKKIERRKRNEAKKERKESRKGRKSRKGKAEK